MSQIYIDQSFQREEAVLSGLGGLGGMGGFGMPSMPGKKYMVCIEI